MPSSMWEAREGPIWRQCRPSECYCSLADLIYTSPSLLLCQKRGGRRGKKEGERGKRKEGGKGKREKGRKKEEGERGDEGGMKGGEKRPQLSENTTQEVSLSIHTKATAFR